MRVSGQTNGMQISSAKSETALNPPLAPAWLGIRVVWHPQASPFVIHDFTSGHFRFHLFYICVCTTLFGTCSKCNSSSAVFYHGSQDRCVIAQVLIHELSPRSGHYPTSTFGRPSILVPTGRRQSKKTAGAETAAPVLNMPERSDSAGLSP